MNFFNIYKNLKINYNYKNILLFYTMRHCIIVRPHQYKSILVSYYIASYTLTRSRDDVSHKAAAMICTPLTPVAP